MQAFIGSPLHAGLGFGKGVDDGKETISFERFRGIAEVGPEGLRETFTTGRGIELGDDKCANGSDDFAEELGEVFSFLELFVDDGKNAARVFLKDAKEKSCDRFARGEPENIEDIVLRDFVSAEGNELVEHGLGIAHATIGTLGNGPSSGVIDFDPFLSGNVLEVSGDNVRGDGAEVKTLAARDDGGKNLVGFGGGEDEFDVGRGLLEGFEEGVKGASGEHVNLVNVDDAEATAGRSKANCFKE